MILKRFLKPKWQHGRPEVRRQAVETLDDPDALEEIARSDPDPAVRRQACKRVNDLDLLAAVGSKDRDAGVREFALARFRHLVCGTDAGSPPLPRRLASLESTSDLSLLEQAAQHGQEPELRQLAVERVETPSLLAECAIRDTVAAVRLAAVRRLDDKPALERVARLIGKKDKRVYRLAKDKLKEIAEREAEPARIRAECQALCERAEGLGRHGTWIQDRALLEHLERQWGSLSAYAGPALAERFRGAREAFSAGYEAFRTENLAQIQAEEARERLRAERHALIGQFATLNALNDAPALATTLAELSSRWEQLERLPEPEQSRLQKQYAEAVASARERLAGIRQRQERKQRLQALKQRVQDLLDQSRPIEARDLKRMERERSELASAATGDTTLDEAQDGLQRLKERLDKQHRRAGQHLDEMPGHLAELEQHLERGELKNATALQQKLHAELELAQATAGDGKRVSRYRQQLQRLLPRLRELQNWRKWGTDQHRAELCARMEALIEADLGEEALAQRVQLMQDEWKKLDHGGSRVNRAMWERFHNAADRVYERCRPYLEAQAQVRAANLGHREALLTQLEEFLDRIDWTRMDWKKAVRAEREMRAAWRDAGPVDNKHRKPLDRRYRTAMKRLDRHLAEERARNRTLKKELIARAEALAEQPDLEQAMAEMKQLQRQWHTTVAGKRRQENTLWQRFREAGDRVFNRKREQQEAQEKTLEENLRTLDALCQELEALSTREDIDMPTLDREGRRLHERWREDRALTIPRRAEKPLDNRWQTARRQFQDRQQQLRRQHEQQQLLLLEQRAQTCVELERRLGETLDAAELAAIRARWEGLPQLEDQALQAAAEERFQQALSIFTEGPDALQRLRDSMDDNLRQRREQCLRMEIAAGAASPPDAQQERLELQVNRLTEHMQHGAQSPLEAERIEREWYLSGPVPPELWEDLAARFERARQALP